MSQILKKKISLIQYTRHIYVYQGTFLVNRIVKGSSGNGFGLYPLGYNAKMKCYGRV